MPAPSCPQIFLKVAQDTGVDADSAGKTPQGWLELSFRVLGCRGGLGGDAQQPGAEGCGCPQHPMWPSPFPGLSSLLGAPMGAGRCHRLFPRSHPGALTPVLSGTRRGAAPSEGGDTEVADGELGKEGGADTWDPLSWPAPAAGCPPPPPGGLGLGPWHVSIRARVRPRRHPFGHASLWAGSGQGEAQGCSCSITPAWPRCWAGRGVGTVAGLGEPGSGQGLGWDMKSEGMYPGPFWR